MEKYCFWTGKKLTVKQKQIRKDYEKIVMPIIQDKINRMQLDFEKELLNSKC